MVVVPAALSASVSASFGDWGRRWLADLPRQCADLGRRWSLTLDKAFSDCHVSLTVSGVQHGLPVVLKIPLPLQLGMATLAGDQRRREADALRVWAGNGTVLLLDHDEASGAMLLERCLPGAPIHDLPTEQADEVAADLLRRLWRPPPIETPFARLADLAAGLSKDLSARLDRGLDLDPDLIRAAADSLIELSAAQGEVLLHGDFHHDNVLSAKRLGWLAIDPLPMVGDPAYDAVQYLLFCKGELADPENDWPRVIRRFCHLLRVEPSRVMAWTFARLVSDAVASHDIGTPADKLEAVHGDLWTARLVRRVQ